MLRNSIFASLISFFIAVTYGLTGAHAASPFPFSWDDLYIGANIGLSRAQGAGNATDCGSVTNILGKYGGWEFADLCDAYGAGHAFGHWLDFDGCGCSGSDDNAYWLGETDRTRRDNLSLGFQVGRNWQVGRLVFGVEGDIRNFGNLRQTSDQAFRYDEDFYGDWDGEYLARSSSSLNWMGTLRGRVGKILDVDGRLLAYATGGVALSLVSADMTTVAYRDGNVDWCSACTFSNPSGTGTFTQPGLTMGGGIEYGLTERLSLGVEYLFTRLYGTRTVTTHFYGDSGRGFDLARKVGFDNVHTVSVKLNFRF